MQHTLILLTALLLAPLAALHAAEPVTIDLAKRTWQGIPGSERTAKGRFFVSWFTGGPKEPAPDNTVVLSYSDDAGKTFTPPEAIALPTNDGTRAFDPALWIDPKGRLWYIFNRGNKDIPKHDVWARICDDPDATPPVFGAEFRVGYDAPYAFRLQKPTVLSSGEWIMPVTHAEEPIHEWFAGPKQLQGVGISTDEGKTWSLHGALKAPEWALECMVTELKDGRLWLLTRTGGGFLWESHSTDKGRTWSEAKASTIANPGSRFFIRRLASGNLLLVNHYKFTGRSHLTAQLSTDDGATWNDGLLLDERKGVSYPDGAQDKDGLIWITYDRDRGGAGEILLAKFKEEDVAAGRNVSGAVSLKQVVNKLNKPDTVPKPAVKVTQELLNSIHVTPKLIFDPMPAYGQKYLPFAMAASMESTKKGRLWTCWAGGQDGPNAYLLASFSDDQGKSWRDPVFVIDPQAHGLKMGTRLGSFWCDPKGRLWLFFHQSVGMFDGSCSNWFVRCDDPDADKPVWTEPVYIGFGASLNKPIVRKNGEWILPVSLWERWHIDKPFADCYHELDAVRGSNVFVSDDEGGHWRYRGGIIYEDSFFNEHSVVELNDGRLWMLERCKKETAQSFSDDGGKTWQPQSTAFPHVNSKAVIRRLQSGHLLVIRHGQDITKATPKRQELTAFLSTDDGKTWSGKLLLDERDNVSYPDIAQAPNGDIYIHYDRDRTGAAEILFARFREEDVQAGKLISKAAALKSIVKSKAHGMNRGEAASAISPKGAKKVSDFPLWDESQMLGEAKELPKLEGVEFHVIKKWDKDADGYTFLHGVGLCWHKDRLYASFAHNKGKENTVTEEAQYRVSDDGGKTWSALRAIDSGEEKDLAVSHGVFVSHVGKLWAFHGAYYKGMERIHTRAYSLDEATGQWTKHGVVIENGFWALNQPVKMTDGNWIMPGISAGPYSETGAFPAAVAISHADDFTKWDFVGIPVHQGIRLWGESSGIVDGPNVLNIARYGGKALALISKSTDFGRTWTTMAESNLPMTTSKPAAGLLSNGRRYLVCTSAANNGGRRSPLTIAISEPGKDVLCRVFVIRHADHNGPGESDPKSSLSYPCAVEHEGKLYVGFSNNGGRNGNLNSAEMAVIPIRSLETKP